MLLGFNALLEEKKKILHVFDMDETLFHYPDKGKEAKVHVLDKDGKKVKSLSNVQFNTHRIEPNHSYDYSDFRSADIFKSSAKPIKKMIKRLKNIHRRNPNVEILTARGDFDNKEEFAKHLAAHGIDINKIHVRRAGNLDKGSIAERKRSIISDQIHKHGYHEVHLYDDSEDNLNHFLNLQHKHPEVKLNAHHIQHNKETGDVHVNKKSVRGFTPDVEWGGAHYYSPDVLKR
jgi:hypothetical protein